MSAIGSYTGVSLERPARLGAAGHELAVFTHASPDRADDNQDAVLVLSPAEDVLVVAVADGAGGYPNGGSASALALQALEQACSADPGLAPRAAIVNGFEAAHLAIKSGGGGSATTLAVIELSGAMLRAYHAGDSGILVTGQRGRVKLQSVVHSPTGYGVEAGLLDESEALHHEQRHMVSNLLGMEPMSLEIGSPLELAPLDTVLIASDGLYDNLYLHEIVDLVRKGPLERACSMLAQTARARMLGDVPGEPSKPDDLSIVLVRRARR